MKLFPHNVMMEGKTVLTQYIITRWSLVYRNTSKSLALITIFLLTNIKVNQIRELHWKLF